MSNLDEQVIARATLYHLDSIVMADQIGNIPGDCAASTELRTLLAVAEECRISGATTTAQVLSAYTETGADVCALMEFTDNPDIGIIVPSSLGKSIERVIARSLVGGFRAAVDSYEFGKLTREDLIATISGSGDDSPAQSITLYNAIREYEEETIPPGVDCGHSVVDRLLGGLRRGRVTILASRPGVGKSDFALSVARNVLRRGQNVYMASVEMDRTEILHRMKRAEGDIEKLKSLLGKMDIDDRGSITVPQIAAAVMVRKPELVIVDYLQILQLNQRTGGMYERASALSNQLRAAAKHSKAAWLVLSQLSRNAKDEQHRPSLSDLRDSGAIEQDAYAVLFLYESENRDYSEEAAGSFFRIVNLLIAKNRGGAAGQVPFEFMPAASQWTIKPRNRTEQP